MKRNPFLLVFLAIIAVSVNAQTEITTAEQFRNLNLDGDYKLMADIDLTKGNYVPIGGKYGYFNGTFDGNGHTIRIKNISDDYQYRGLFSQVGSEGVIKNLKVSGQMDNSMSVSSRVGGIAGRNDGMIINCFSSVHVNCSGVLNNQPRSQTGGGIAGVNTGTISYCVAAGSIMGASYSGGIGGIVGVNYSNNSGKIDNCIYGGDAIDILENTSTSYYGMICGDVHDNSWANNVSNCYYKTNDALTGLGSSGRRVSDELRCTPLDQEEFRALVAEDGIYASTEYDVFQKSILKAVAPYYYLNFDTQLTDGYSTFYNGDCGYSFDSDGTIYTGVIKDSRILLTALEGKIIPKGVPVVIRSKKRYFSLYKTYDEVSFTGNNDLKGTNTDFACQPNTKYVLSSEDGDIGFGLFNGNTIKANTAYIPWQEAIDDYEFLSILTIEPSPAITFADNIVKAICVANWDYNGDGELNEGEAAAVNDLGQVFKGNTEIISFNELRFFTGLNSIGDYQFSGCSNLKEIMFPPNISSIGKGAFGSTGFERIDIPEGISSIGKEAFARCNNLIRVSLPSTMQTIGNYAFAWSDNRLSVIFSSATPPTLKTAPFYSTYVKSVAYVPIGSKAEYEGYNSYFDKIIEINTELLPLLPQTLTSNIPSTKTYGDATFTLPNITDEGVAITWTTTNTQVISISSNNITIKNAGTTVITAKNDGSNDYLPFSQEFTLTVNKAPLSITANDKTKMKGEDIPELTISYEGFKYNDDSSVLTMQPTVTTTATKDSPIGIYPIIVNGAASNNYEITHINGNLSVISPIIPFVDANVKAICVENWDTDGDGELSEDEAAAVTDLGEVFKENKSITSFDELRYFSQLTSIGNYAFKDCSNLTSVTIPNSVSTIGELSFHRCWALNSLDIPNSVISIGGNAFYSCVGLKSLIIPNSVTSIGASAFFMCDNLASITITSSVTSIGSYAFGGTKWFNNQPDGLVYAGKVAYLYKGTMAENTNLILDEGTLGIAGDAFSGCTNLSSISLPNGLKVIGASAFWGCSNVTSIVLPSSLSTIDNTAFANCTSLTTVKAKMNLPINIRGDAFPNRSNITLFVPYSCETAYEAADYWKEFKDIVEMPAIIDFADANVKVLCVANWDTDGDGELSEIEAAAVTDLGQVFTGNTQISSFEELEFFTGLTTIGTNAFSRCTNLSIVTMPNSVTSIGYNAFGSCNKITSIVIPNSVTTIEKNAFLCSGLTSVTIPDGVLSIEDCAFSSCSNLVSFDIPNSISYLGTGVFGNTAWEDNQPNGLLYVGNFLCGYKGEMPGNTIIEIKDGTKGIVNMAFYGRSKISAVTVPNSVVYIGKQAFFECSALTSINIPNSVTSIGEWAFAYCTKLTSIDIPNSLSSIENHTFTECGLTNVSIPNSVTNIGLGAFYGCINMISVVIPSSVIGIEACVFEYCSNLTSVIIENLSPITIDSSTFSNRANATLYVPAGAKATYEKADYWKEFGCILEQGTVLTENNSIYAEDASVYIGYTADLQINMSNEDTFTAYQFDLVLPNGITLAKDEKGKYIVTLSNRHYDNTHQVTIDDIGDNTFRFVCVSLNTSVINGNDGAILTVSLKANNGIAEGELNATIKNVILTTADETKMKPKDSSFTIKTKTLLKGDADGDGEIDVTDVVSTINYIIGNPSAKFNFLAADLNEDGEVDIFDVMMAINLVFSQKNSSRSLTRATGGSEEQAIVKAADDRIIFGVNDASRFTAFQFDVEVVNGVELKEVCLNADTHHDLQFVRIGEDSYRVIGVSMDNSTLTTNGNDFVELRLSKECDAQISNIVFVTPDETKVHFAGSYVNLTDIRNTTLDQSEEIFDLSGRKIDAERSRLPKGVYIINNKKVVIK